MHIDEEIIQQLGSERAEEVQEQLADFFDDMTIMVPVRDEVSLISVMFKVQVGDEFIYVTKDIQEGEGKRFQI